VVWLISLPTSHRIRFWLLEQELAHPARVVALAPQGVEVEPELQGVEVEQVHLAKEEALVNLREPELACLGEAMVNQAQGGFERLFSCLCADPCGSPLNRWMRVES
jgi:hypothetical protein